MKPLPVRVVQHLVIPLQVARFLVFWCHPCCSLELNCYLGNLGPVERVFTDLWRGKQDQGAAVPLWRRGRRSLFPVQQMWDERHLLFWRFHRIWEVQRRIVLRHNRYVRFPNVMFSLPLTIGIGVFFCPESTIFLSLSQSVILGELKSSDYPVEHQEEELLQQ